MKCGKTNLCDLDVIKGKYQVTWSKHITGLSVYDDKAIILLNMIINDAKSNEIGILISGDMVLWLSSILLHQSTLTKIIKHLVTVGQVKNPKDIKGAIFDNMEDVELFVDRLEKKYIIHVLKQ